MPRSICQEEQHVKMKTNGKSKGKMLWQLFASTFILSASTFGGGFVIVSLMKEKFVEKLKWIDEEEMLDITAIAQSSPGPIPINASIILGYRMRGLVGALVAVLGTTLPPVIIISLIAVFYDWFRENKYISVALQVMRAGVAAVIFDVVWKLTENVVATKRILYMAVMIIAFIATFFLGVSAMIIIFACIIIGVADLLLNIKGRKETKG